MASANDLILTTQTTDGNTTAAVHAVLDSVVGNPHPTGGGFSFAYGYYFAFYFSNSTPSSAARQVPHG